MQTLPATLRTLARECPTATAPERWEPYREAMIRAAEALELVERELIHGNRSAALVSRDVEPR